MLMCLDLTCMSGTVGRNEMKTYLVTVWVRDDVNYPEEGGHYEEWKVVSLTPMAALYWAETRCEHLYSDVGYDLVDVERAGD